MLTLYDESFVTASCIVIKSVHYTLHTSIVVVIA